MAIELSGPNTVYTFTVTRGISLTAAATVNWAVTGTSANPVNGADFLGGLLPSGQLTFTAGVTVQTIEVTVLGDSIFEANEQFTLTISNPSTGVLVNPSIAVTITNDDVVEFAISGAPVISEDAAGIANFLFTVTRFGDISTAHTIDWNVSGNGSNPAIALDFVGRVFPSGQLTFAPNEVAKTISTLVAYDETLENNETFAVTISNPSSGAITAATATGTITNDDAVNPASLDISVTRTAPEAAQFVLRSSLSATESDINTIVTSGYESWLNTQLNAPITETGLAFFTASGYDTLAFSANESGFAGDSMIWTQLAKSENAVRKRAALGLSEFFVVSMNGQAAFWRGHAMAYYWDILNANVFGNFRTLLEQVTLAPAMGKYLGTRLNLKENVVSGRVPDQNYAREIMQLFTIGLFELNNDGTRKVDGNGNFIPTYTNADVAGLSYVFTGYENSNVGVQQIDAGGYTIPSWHHLTQPMTSNYVNHFYQETDNVPSTLASTFLGLTIPANTAASVKLQMALDHLFNHPNVGPFFAEQMIQRLVTSNPSPSYISRVAAKFNNNGSGVRGDLRATFKAILIDPEAQGVRAREPMLRITQFMRTFGSVSQTGKWRVGDTTFTLGQAPLHSPSVFNYYRPGYVPPNTEIAIKGLKVPEYQIANEVGNIQYINFVQDMIENRFTFIQYATPETDVTTAFTAFLGLTDQQLLDKLDLLLTGNQLSASTRATILSALGTQTIALKRVKLAATLIMVSPDYIVQKD